MERLNLQIAKLTGLGLFIYGLINRFVNWLINSCFLFLMKEMLNYNLCDSCGPPYVCVYATRKYLGQQTKWVKSFVSLAAVTQWPCWSFLLWSSSGMADAHNQSTKHNNTFLLLFFWVVLLQVSKSCLNETMWAGNITFSQWAAHRQMQLEMLRCQMQTELNCKGSHINKVCKQW